MIGAILMGAGSSLVLAIAVGLVMIALFPEGRS